jgi:thiamine biosynthesis lipoprotein ApbE
LDLKKQYKTLTGTEYKPPTTTPTVAQKENQAPSATASAPTSTEADALANKITVQGEKVRELKTNKANKVGARHVF